MKNFYKIGFFALLALVLMASSSLPSILEVKPAKPKSIVVFTDLTHGNKIQTYAEQGYIFKQMIPVNGTFADIKVVMEKY